MLAAMMDTREIVINNLQQKLDVLKTNRDNVPLNELKTRYKNSYNKLLGEIRTAYEVLSLRLVRGIDVDVEHLADIQFLWDNQYKKNVEHAMYKEYDALRVYELLYDFSNEVICKFSKD